MVSESQERMLAIVEPEKVGEVLAICARWETGGTVIGEVTGRRRDPGLRRRRQVGDIPVALLVDELPALRPRAGRAARPGSTATARDARRPTTRRETLLALLGLADASPRSAGPSSSTTRSCSRGPFAAPSRPTPRSCRSPRPAAGDRRLDRRQRAPRRLRSLRGHGRGGARVRAEPRLRRRRAARPHQLPQLRQPGEADGRLAARPRRSRGWPTPARRSASRSSAATSRSTTRRTGARSTRRRSSAWSASCPIPRSRPAWRRGGRRDRARRALRTRRSPGSELAKLRGELGRRACPDPTSTPVAAAIAAVREAVRGGGLSSAHDISDGGLACALAECAIAGEIGLEVDLGDLIAVAWRLRRGLAVRRGPRRVRGRAARPTRLGASGRCRAVVLLSARPAATGLGDRGGRGPHRDQHGRGGSGVALARRSRSSELGARRVSPPAAASLGPQVSRLPERLDSAGERRPPSLERDLVRRPRRPARRVRRVRRLRARARRLAPRLLRALRASASRPGVGRASRPARAATSRRCATSGLVSQVFDEQKLQALAGRRWRSATCATRPPAAARWENAQPVWRDDGREVALAHNGNLTNAVELLRRAARARRSQFRGTSDSEIIAALLSSHEARRDRGRGRRGDAAARGRLLDRGDDQARRRRLPRPARGPAAGARPARRPLRASPRRAAPSTSSAPSCCARCSPGEMVSLERARASRCARRWSPSGTAFCVFEHIYFSRPDSRLEGRVAPAGPRPDGRDPLARGAGRRRPRDLGPRLRQPRRRRLLARLGAPQGRRPDQEPLRRPHLHPARPGAAQARPAA